MKEHKYSTIQETAESYGKEKLKEIVDYLNKRDLRSTAPFVQFEALLNCLNKVENEGSKVEPS